MTTLPALGPALPEIVMALGAIAMVLYGAIQGERSTRTLEIAALALLALALVLVLRGEGKVVTFNGAFIADGFARFMKVLTLIGAAAAIVLSADFLRRDGAMRFEFPILVVLATIGMMMMISANDLIGLYVGLELQSLALYVVAAFDRDNPRSTEAGLKYFVLGALSSGMLLYGGSLVYGFTGTVSYAGIAEAVKGGHPGIGLIIGLVFVAAGVAFKISAVPFHMWTPDVYEGAPTPVAAFFASAPKMAAMAMTVRVFVGAFPGALHDWQQIIVFMAIASMALGAFAAIGQSNIKRLLAYSSIANMGYALLAIAAGTTVGVKAMLAFGVLYIIDVTGFFACLLALSRNGRPIVNIADLAGLKVDRPGTAIVITFLSLSVLGMPPFSGFWAKVFVFGAAIQGGLWIFAALGLAASVVAAFYYLRIIKLIWFDPSPGLTDPAPRDAQWVAYAAAAFSFPLVLFALGFLDRFAATAASSLGLG